MKYVIDRIEENFAVCEDENRKMSEIALSEFPWEVKECLAFSKIGDEFQIVSNEERYNRIKAKMNNLYKND